MNVNMQIADHSGTFCSSLSGYVQIRGLKERGDFHHDERQIKKQKSTDRVSVSPCAVFTTQTHRSSTADEDVPRLDCITKLSK